MNIIAIVEEHLWLIGSLNNGNIPQPTDEVTFFIHDEENGNDVLTAREALVQYPDAADYIARFV